MLRLVALFLVALLGRTAAEGIVRRPVPFGTASWESSFASPSHPASRVQRVVGGVADAVTPPGALPHSGPASHGAGKAFVESRDPRRPARAALAAFSLAAGTSSARLTAFPYDANAPPAKA